MRGRVAGLGGETTRLVGPAPVAGDSMPPPEVVMILLPLKDRIAASSLNS